MLECSICPTMPSLIVMLAIFPAALIAKPTLPTLPFHAVFWDAKTAVLGGRNKSSWQLTQMHYEEQALVFALQGLVNRDLPRLFLDVGSDDFDNPESSQQWRSVLESGNFTPEVAFDTSLPPDLCALIAHFLEVTAGGAIIYASDGFSIYPALTLSGLHGHLPVSEAILEEHTCLRQLPIAEDLRAHAWNDTYSAHRWAIDNLLPACNRSIVFNANYGPKSLSFKGGLFANTTLMSVDLAVRHRAFVMNLNPDDELPQDMQLFQEILSRSDPLVAVWGWSDPENTYTKTATLSGGIVFCTIATPNLSFWRILSEAANVKAIPLPHHDSGERLDRNTYYILFVTNEGDTPRILTSQFARAWYSPRRGSVPVGWGINPVLAEEFPALWNSLISTATPNDTWVAGVSGVGYVFLEDYRHLPELQAAYEERAGQIYAKYAPDGIAVDTYGKASLDDLQVYSRNAARNGGLAAALYTNGEANHAQNDWLPDGTPVVQSEPSVFYYYMSTPPEKMADRIVNATTPHSPPFFLHVYGGLRAVPADLGSPVDTFELFEGIMDSLSRRTIASGARYKFVGAQEFARLARDANPQSTAISL